MCQHVSETLPDSIARRKELLQSLISIIGEQHRAFESVCAQLAAIEKLELLQKELPLKFSTVAKPSPERDGQ